MIWTNKNVIVQKSVEFCAIKNVASFILLLTIASQNDGKHY